MAKKEMPGGAGNIGGGQQPQERECECDEYKLSIDMRCPIHAPQPPTQESWEDRFDEMFDWAEQIKDEEIARWKVVYGFIPNDLKQFIGELLAEALSTPQIVENLKTAEKLARKNAIAEVKEIVERYAKFARPELQDGVFADIIKELDDLAN